MPISDPQIVRFDNVEFRPWCNLMADVYRRAKILVDNYNAANLGTQINNAGAAEVIVDGAGTDGRNEIAGGDIFNGVNAAMDLIKFVEGADVPKAVRLNVILLPHHEG